tara:strand:+ start:1346 stop:2521 length:1176 start_codon:yes stop_codon:yes gene_type:complete
MNTNLRIQNTADYYTAKRNMLTELGLRDPATDSDDPRQRLMWNYIVSNNLTIDIKSSFDFVANLADHSSLYYKYFQARVACENEERIQSLYEEFYESNIPMERVIMGFKLSDGKVYVAVGNHRSRAHRRAQMKGISPKGQIIILGDDLMPDEEKLMHGHALASMSNTENLKQTDAEYEDDIAHQLKQAWSLTQQADSTKSSWEQEDKIEWAKDWVKLTKPRFCKERMKIRLSRLVNSVFADHVGQSLPFPENNEIDKNLKRFWPRDLWNPDIQSNITQLNMPTHIQFCQRILGDKWRSRSNATPVRDIVWFAVRCGSTLDKKTTHVENIEKTRQTFINNMIQLNKNPNHIMGGFPIVKRILFVKQLDCNDYCAYEWNDAREEFDEINEIKV